jgi:hypothetical protein
MDENDTTFESDSNGNVEVKGDAIMEGKEPYRKKTPGREFLNFDPGSGKGEARSGKGSGTVEVDLPDPPSDGENPTQKGNALTGEASDALDIAGENGGNSSNRGRPRIDKDRIDANSGNPRKRFYNNISELEKEVEKEQKNIKEIVDNLVNKCKEQQDILQEKINQAGSNHNGLATGVFGKLPPISALPTAPPPRPLPPGLGSQPNTPSTAPLGQKVRRTYFHLEFAKTNASPDNQLLIDIAQETFNKADQLCAIGDLENGNQALESVDTLTQAALSPDLRPSPPGSPAPPGSASEVEQRANAQNTGLDLYGVANSLNNAGFSNLASSIRVTAEDLLNFGLGLARSSKLLDLPLNLVEAFAGKTLEFSESGELVVREATTIERVFAVLDVALTIGVLITGGLPALLGAGVLSVIDKETAKKLEKLVEGFRDKANRGEYFDFPEFPGYLDRVPKPVASPRIIRDNEYKIARNAANNANKAFRVQGKQVHEILPVKFGGSPTDPANKILLSQPDHVEISIWWRTIQRLITGK